MHRSVSLSIPLLCLLTLAINCPFVPSADALDYSPVEMAIRQALDLAAT